MPLLGGVIGAETALAQVGEYKVRALPRLPGTDVAEAFAVNANGIVVGRSILLGPDPFSETDDASFPTIWFSHAWTGGGPITYAAWTAYNLGAIVGAGSSGAAWDLNDDDIVVGYIEVQVGGEAIHRPFVWDLSAWIPNGSGGGAFRSHVLGDFGEEGPARGGEALGINNELDPMIVGFANRDEQCLAVGGRRSFGFHHRLSTADSVVFALEPVDPSDLSRTYAVTTSNDPYRAAGGSDGCGSQLPCSTQADSLQWIVGGSVAELSEQVSPAAGSLAEDINDLYFAVGWQSYDDPDPPPPGGEPTPAQCRYRAAFWDATSGALTIIHDAAGFDNALETLAHAIAPPPNTSDVFAVGEETTLDLGILWKRDAAMSVWTAWTADDLRISPCDQPISRLNDVNGCLWCVGARAPLDGPPSPQAVVLLPYCAGDANVDGTVDALDLAVVLGAWGSSWTEGYGCEVASPDADQNGVVDGIDLAILLGGWGPCCPTFSSGLPFGAGAAGKEAALGLPSTGGAFDPELMIAVLGFNTVESLSAWLDSATAEQREAMASLVLSVATSNSGGEQ